jgi:phosphate/sulfate permease
VQIKTWIIFIVISFFLGAIVAGGISYSLYSKSSRKYADDVKVANELNRQLRDELDKSKDIINQLTEGNTNEQVLVKRLADSNKQLVDGLKKGSIQK